MAVIIKATPIVACDLVEGDLFSTAGPAYWDNFSAMLSIGERVYIRTGRSSYTAPDADEHVFKIEIIRK
jgi:hypothetical protein